jgi:hypothetical protein
MILSYSRSLCPLFKESTDIHLGDFPAFLRKRPQEILEVVSEDQSCQSISRNTANCAPHRIESADAIESTDTWDALEGTESQLLKR